MIGKILVLYNSIFSQCYAKRETVTNNKTATLCNNLESLCMLWLKLELSIILKFYLLLCHLLNFLLRIQGFLDMTESHIKRYYQEKKDRTCLSQI